MSRFWKRFVEAVSPTKRSVVRLGSTTRRTLGVEHLESRQLMATDFAIIQGAVFQDSNGNGTQDSGEVGIGNVTLELFRETNGTAGFQSGAGGDAAVLNSGTAVTTTTSNTSGTLGQYTFGPSQLGGSVNGLTAGTYYVRQATVTGFTPAASPIIRTVTITSTDAAGRLNFNPIDDFSIPSTPSGVTTNSGTPTASLTFDGSTANIIGGERDLFANLTTGSANFGINSGSGELNFFADPGANGTRSIVWDGNDSNATALDTNGLGGADLTNAGASNAIRILAGTNRTGVVGRLTIYSGASSAFIDINFPDNGAVTSSPNSEQILLFSNFQRPSGQTGAFDFSSVGAIELTTTDTNPVTTDIAVDIIAPVGPTVLAANIADPVPMTIGNLVFLDRNNDGDFDSSGSNADTGIGGVTVQLYNDTDANGTLSSAELAAQTTPRSTTTSVVSGLVGTYTFSGVAPGRYIVVIPASQFATGQPLLNYASSPGASTALVDGVDRGAPFTNNSTFAGVFAPVNLVAGSGPTNDSDNDVQTDLTVDFGLVSAPLTIDKEDAPNAVRVGDTITYTITVENTGPSLSTNTIVTDPLPTGLSNAQGTFVLTNPSATGGNVSVSGSTVTANVGTLASGQRAVITFTALVGSTYTGTAANTASVDNTESDPVTDNITTPLVPTGDLGVTKTIVSGATVVGSENRVGIGTTITYRLTLTNNSPTGGPTVSNIRVDDNLPTGFTIVGTPPTGVATGSDPADLIWTITSLAAGASTSVDLPIAIATTVATGSTPIPNTATIRTSLLTNFNDTNGGLNESGSSAGNNFSTINVVAEPRYDLLVTKQDASGKTSAVTGEQYTYTLSVNNSGPSAATNVVVTDTLPAQLEFVNATSTNNSVVFTNGQNFSATVPTLASGATVDIVLTVRVRSSATGANILNTATVAASNPSQETAGRTNTATDTNTLTRVETLNLTKVDSTDPVVAGGTAFTYTVVAFNSGSADAASVVITDPLPAGIELVDTSNPGSFNVNETTPRTGTLTYNSSTRTVTASVGTLLAGGSSTVNRAQFVINVRATGTAAAGQVTNTASVTNGGTPVTAPQQTTIQRSLDLGVTKTTTATNAVAGQDITYTILVSYASGSSTAQDILVTDVLPSNLTFQTVTTTSPTLQAFANSNGTITGRLTSLAPGQTATVTVTARVVNGTPDGTTVTNPVTISTTDDSGTGGNNSSSSQLTVQSLVTLSGVVYFDSNGNSVQDNGETGIPNVTVTLRGTGAVANVTQTTTTAANGTYSFTGLTRGVYNVTETQPPSFTGTNANPGTQGGVAAANAINTIDLTNGSATANNFPEDQDLSKRGMLASALNRPVTTFNRRFQ